MVWGDNPRRAQSVAPHARVPVRLLRADGTIETFDALVEIETTLEATLLRSGGMIPHILRGVMSDSDAFIPVASGRT